MSHPHPPPPRPPPCVQAPLLRFLIPVALLLLLAHTTSAFIATTTAAGAATIAWAFARFFASPNSVSFFTALLLGCTLAWRMESRPPLLWQDQPAREAILTLRVTETFHARKPARLAGLGRITQSHSPALRLQNHRVSFYLETSEPQPPPLATGETLRIKARLAFLPALPRPDDFQLYLLSRDIFLTANQGSVLHRPRDPPPLEQWRRQLYHQCQDWLTAACTSPADPGFVMASMLLGNRALLNDERIQLYRSSGTYHLFAVSGLHVGAVALCIHFLLRILCLPAPWRVLPAIAGVWLYVWLTGSAPSAVRAGIMITCLMGSRHLLRQPQLFPALVFSAAVVLLWSPRQLFHLGFQLSYAVVAAILLIGLPLARRIEEWLHTNSLPGPEQGRLNRWARAAALRALQVVAISSSASLASAPLIVQHFELLTPAGWLIAPFLGPLAATAVFLGCTVFLVSPFSATAGAFLGRLAWPVIDLMEFFLQTALRLPGAVSSRQFAAPAGGTSLLLAALLLAWLLQSRRQQGATLPWPAFFLPQIILLFGLALTWNSS